MGGGYISVGSMEAGCWCSTENLLPISLVGRSLKLSLITCLWVCECCTRGFSSRHKMVAVGNHFWLPIFALSSSDLQQLVVQLTRIDRRPFAENQRLSTIAGIDVSLVIVQCLYNSCRPSHDHSSPILDNCTKFVPQLVLR